MIAAAMARSGLRLTRCPLAALAAIGPALRPGGHEVVEDGPVEGRDRVYVDDPFGNRIELIEEGNG